MDLGLCQAEVGVARLGGTCLSELLSWGPGPRERLPSARMASWGPSAPTPACEDVSPRKGRRVLTAHRRSSVKQQVLTCSCWVRPADLGILLGMALGNEGLEPWPLTQSDECAVTGFLRDKLQYRNRLQYMVPSGPRRVLFPRPLAHRTKGPGVMPLPGLASAPRHTP